MTKTTEQLFQAVIDSMQALSEAVGTTITEDSFATMYPFASSFEEVIEEVRNWQEAVVNESETVTKAIEFKKYLHDCIRLMDTDEEAFYKLCTVVGFGGRLIVLENSAATYNGLLAAVDYIIEND